MLVDDLVRNPGSWLSHGRDTGVVVSSRARLARNIRDVAFPDWAGEEERLRVWSEMRGVLAGMPGLADALILDMGELAPVDRAVLRERHLASLDLTEKGAGSGLVVSQSERIAVMVNEEDHLRLQAITPGMELLEMWRELDALDTALEERVEYAYHPELGYLTACPTNVGTGLRGSVMLHLAGLALMNEVEAVIKGLNRMGYEVRGLLGEGSEASGNMYQISNRVTLGQNEEDTVRGIIAMAEEVVRHETNARLRLMEGRRVNVLDHVGRAYGILSHARVLSSGEAVHLLSALRLGVDFGLVENLTPASINDAMLLTQPGHLQKTSKRNLSPGERDELRAGMIKKHLKGVCIAR
ncbi:MAG: protein arginine kinase [Lentisphaerae bacterium]|nr:protein arginine kinase [Lentisphaerota bacterium]